VLNHKKSDEGNLPRVRIPSALPSRRQNGDDDDDDDDDDYDDDDDDDDYDEECKLSLRTEAELCELLVK
jgi:hypothetical protein